MVKIIFLLMVFCSHWSFAHEKIVLTVTQSDPKFSLRYSLLFEQDRLTLASNSNTLCGPEKLAHLGLFEKKPDSAQKTHFNFLNQIALRLKAPTTQHQASEHHQLRYYIGEHEVDKDTPSADTVRRIVGESCSESGWVTKNAVEASIVKTNGIPALSKRFLKEGKQTSLELTPLVQAPCTHAGKTDEKHLDVFDCDIEKYGKARLIAEY